MFLCAVGVWSDMHDLFVISCEQSDIFVGRTYHLHSSAQSSVMDLSA